MEFGILDCFMIAFVSGMVFGLVYEFFRIIRRILPYTPIIMVCDISFFIAAGFFIFELSMYLGNFVRLYTILGFGAGLFTYIQTIGRLLTLMENTLLRLLSAVFGALADKVSGTVKGTIRIIAHNTNATFGRFHDFLKRILKSASSLLHFNTKRVYNVKRNIYNYGENIGGNNVIQVKIRRSSREE